MFRLKQIVTTSFDLADRYDHKKAQKHTCLMLVTNKNFFRVTQSQTLLLLKRNFLSSHTALKGNWHSGSMKFEESLSVYVCDHKFRLKRVVTISFILAVRYDLSGAHKHTCAVVVTNKKFFRDTQSQTL